MNISKPNRKKHSYVQQLRASPETIFPLMCPVREAEWVPGWLPEKVISESGVCEKKCVFITPPETSSEPECAIWIVTRHEPKELLLEMYKVAPGHTVSKLDISLEENPRAGTAATIAYELTAIGASGEEFMKEFTDEWYEQFMIEWETQLNYYLETGRKIA